MARQVTDPTDIRAFLRLSDRVTTSGAIGLGDPPRLAAIGVRHVINLALGDHPEILPDASERWAAEGIRYTHIPVRSMPRMGGISEPLRLRCKQMQGPCMSIAS